MLEHIVLDKDSAVSLHYQLARHIEQAIAEGSWIPETELPNESEFCGKFQVSRSTVRQAFRELLENGSVYRPKPRGRLRVMPKRIHQKLGFTRLLYGFPVQTDIPRRGVYFLMFCKKIKITFWVFVMFERLATSIAFGPKRAMSDRANGDWHSTRPD